SVNRVDTPMPVALRRLARGWDTLWTRTLFSALARGTVEKVDDHYPTPAALFRSEHLDGDTASVDRAGPARIERHVGDQPFQLGLRHAVVERPLHMAPHLVGPVERSQHGHRDQAPVALAEVGVFPNVAEQHVVAELPKLGNELVYRRFLLSHLSISSSRL